MFLKICTHWRMEVNKTWQPCSVRCLLRNTTQSFFFLSFWNEYVKCHFLDSSRKIERGREELKRRTWVPYYHTVAKLMCSCLLLFGYWLSLKPYKPFCYLLTHLMKRVHRRFLNNSKYLFIFYPPAGTDL